MNKNDLIVSYFPSDLCNFNCDYCSRLLNVNNDIYRYGDIKDIDNLTPNKKNITLNEEFA